MLHTNDLAMKPMINLNDLMEEQLREIFDGEKRLVKALNEILEKASHPKLRETIMEYKQSCDDNVLRLKQAFNLLFTQKRGERCIVMCAMLEEAGGLMERSMELTVMDAGIITALQHIMHYKMAGYGAISNYATTVGLYEVAGLVHKNLDEEKKVDKELAALAESAVNMQAI